MKRSGRWLVLALVGGVMPCMALAAGSADEEIAAAMVHATAASHVDTVAGVQLHLHHVINCLVGAQGKRFDAKAEALSEHPCKNLGHGAIADAGRQHGVHGALEQALAAAERGTQAGNLAAAHADAAAALKALDVARHASR